MNFFRKQALVVVASMALAACAGSGPEMETVDYVDLERFMGDWYVIANIPTFIEEGAHNAVESYRLDDDGTIATTFTFRNVGDGVLRIGIAQLKEANQTLWQLIITSLLRTFPVIVSV